MGFLEAGTPLPFLSSLSAIEYVRTHGVLQFCATYERVKGRTNDVLKWGDEIEYHLVEFRPASRETRLSLMAPELIALLEKEDAERVLCVGAAGGGTSLARPLPPHPPTTPPHLPSPPAPSPPRGAPSTAPGW